MSKSSCVIVSTTVGDPTAAQALGRAILKERLAACVHSLPVQSAYWWKGKLEESRELRVEAKTRRALAGRLQDFIRAHHSYEVPEIVVTPVIEGLPEYLQWIERETARPAAVPAARRRPRRK